MPKTRNAFAFRGFDATKILQRPYFRQFGFSDSSDEEILRTLIVADEDELATIERKNRTLKAISDGLNHFYDLIAKRHADWTKGRLENYRRELLKKFSADAVASKLNREQDLLGFYTTTVLPPFTDLTAYVAVLWQVSEQKLQAEYRRRFGKRLRQARETAGLSRKKFADACGITTNALHFYENGVREPSLTSLKRFSRTLKTSIDLLLE